MCPDADLLSAFVDGEVPSPWKERIEAHIRSCPSCAAKVEEYRKLDAFLIEERRGYDSVAAAERVRARLGSLLDQPVPALASRKAGGTSRTAAAAAEAVQTAPADAEDDGASGRRAARHVPGSFWGRAFVIPAPLAAAAALAILLLAGFLALSVFKSRPAAAPVQTLAAGEIKPGSNQSDSMEALVNYLESQDAQVNVTIQLPAAASGYSSRGKPLVVTASSDGAAQSGIESAGSVQP